MAVAPKRMTGVSPAGMHGRSGQNGWAAPLVARECDKLARPGYNSKAATEYVDEPEVLQAKVRLLGAMLRESRACAAYTGAGISTASGIKDYASKATDSVGCKPKPTSPLLAEPTLAHRVLTELHFAGHLKHWVQQNHDGLPQKAGFPPEHLNEIHGAWFDPSNPVVPMSGTLRSDLFAQLEEWTGKADLVLALGTSLCGMNADSIVAQCAKRAAKAQAIGSVIIGLQQTVHDEDCSLRIFGRMDDVMALLCTEMQLQVRHSKYAPKVDGAAKVGTHAFAVPYGKAGKALSGGDCMVWDLRTGAKVEVAAGPGKGFQGQVVGLDANGHYKIELPRIREGHKDHGLGKVQYTLGAWWVQSATEGKCAFLPVVNTTPRLTTFDALRAERGGAAAKPKPKAKPKAAARAAAKATDEQALLRDLAAQTAANRPVSLPAIAA